MPNNYESSGRKGASERQKRFLLVVDSSPQDLFYTAMLLQNFGYNVTTVHTAEEALDIMSVAVPALVITDLALTRMKGLDLLISIKQNPRTSSIPVIIQTSATAFQNEETCVKAGCIMYLNKPIQAHSLYRAVQSAIESTPRQNIRISAYLKVAIGESSGQGGPEGALYATVLSEDGMYIKTLQPPPKNTRLHISFVINERTISTEAVVLYRFSFGEAHDKEPGMGIKFLYVSREDRERIREFIKEKIAEGITPIQDP